ncbi:MAG: hypothetical protein ACLT8C_05090 [Akkermansia muciniphila]
MMGFSERFPRKPEPDSLLPSSAPGAGSRSRCVWWGTPPMTNTVVNAGTRLVLVGWASSRSALTLPGAVRLCGGIICPAA